MQSPLSPDAGNEASFYHAMMQAPVGIAIYRGPHYVVEVANPVHLSIVDKTEHEVIGYPLLEALPELRSQGFREILDDVVRTGKAFQGKEYQVNLRRGGEIETAYVNFTLHKLPASHPDQIGVLSVATEVTQQIRQQQDSQQRLSVAIEAAGFGTWELDYRTNNVEYDERYVRLFGYASYIPMTRQQMTAHFHPDDMAVRQQALEEARRTGNLQYETRILWKDGSVHWVQIKGKVFYDEQGQPWRMLGTMQDITATKSIEEELEKRVAARTEELQLTNLHLERSNQELEQYAYVASHDLQEPLRKILTYSSILQRQLELVPGTPPANTLLKITHAAERMSSLIYDLLNFSRLSKTEVTQEAVDLNPVLQDVMTDLELVVQQKGATLVADTLPTVQAIPLQMNQLLYNLLNNSLKFSREKVPPQITICATTLSAQDVLENKNLLPHHTYTHITLTDNGIGFSPEDAAQIFEVFRRLHTRDIYPGSGIGLALCRKIVRNHNGDIYATGSEGHGATFHILLPTS
jgi:PAS domain S-box-containing protein